MAERDLYAPSAATLAGDNADIYFRRSCDILAAEQLNPVVAMEVFARQRALLCGLREAQALLRQVLGPEAEVWSLDEGDWIEPHEVVLRICAPYRQFGLYETALLGMLSSETGWATAAAECVAAADGVPIVSFGARHVHPEVSARMEYAAIVGGCAGCATPRGAALAGIEATGTMPHALILCLGDTLKAVEAFDRHIDAEVERIALVDTFRDEAEESLRLAAALGERLWGVRLDTPSERGGGLVCILVSHRSYSCRYGLIPKPWLRWYRPFFCLGGWLVLLGRCLGAVGEGMSDHSANLRNGSGASARSRRCSRWPRGTKYSRLCRGRQTAGYHILWSVVVLAARLATTRCSGSGSLLKKRHNYQFFVVGLYLVSGQGL